MLSKVWKAAEEAYQRECINSEHALQAILYKAMTDLLPTERYLILVEPGLVDGHVPDLVVIDRHDPENLRAACIIEIKCEPHLEHSQTGRRIFADLEKLQGYFDLAERGYKFVVDVFGPNRKFDQKTKKWEAFDSRTKEWKDRPSALVSEDTLIVFADIARKESDVLDREKIKHPITARSNFVLLSGATDPESRAATFLVM